MPLWIVATPIGNLDDISERAKKVLAEADVLVCESVERAKILYGKLKIPLPKLIHMPAPREQELVPKIIKELEEGKNVVVISSAGTPAVHDPGSALVREALARGIKVIPVPGPSACVSALSVSGMPSRFIFAGFPPKKGKEGFFKSIRRAVEELDFPVSVVIYESPHQLSKTLRVILDVFGDVEVVLAREMTKLHEEILRDKVSNIIGRVEEGIKGEITLVIYPYER